MQVKAHEIVGIAGVSGNGQRQLVEVLAGQRLLSGGAADAGPAPARKAALTAAAVIGALQCAT